MKSIVSLGVLFVALMIAGGCGAKGPRSQTAGTAADEAVTPPSGEGHAVAGVVPGSYEDWCEEHAVPESQCTRCDPSLIPAFQAVNDWDAEHGLPMSQCSIHNPKLEIVRPPKREGR